MSPSQRDIGLETSIKVYRISLYFLTLLIVEA